MVILSYRSPNNLWWVILVVYFPFLGCIILAPVNGQKLSEVYRLKVFQLVAANMTILDKWFHNFSVL